MNENLPLLFDVAEYHDNSEKERRNAAAQAETFEYEQARCYAIKAFKLLSSNEVDDHMEGLEILDVAKSMSEEAVKDVERELEEKEDKWFDNYPYQIFDSQGKEK